MEDLASVEDTLRLLLSRVPPLKETENLALRECLSAVLAEDVSSPLDIPLWDNSSMDGYALSTGDIPPGEEDFTLPQGVIIRAGDPPGLVLKKGTCARIYTGAPLPQGADTVVPQEYCSPREKEILFPRKEALQGGAFIRLRGMDMARGEVVLKAGEKITALETAVAASLGLTHLKVFRKLKIAIVISGDEVITIGEPRKPGKLYNSNEFLMKNLLQSIYGEVVFYALVEDSYQAMETALSQGAAAADVILTSGGASVGGEDYLHRVAGDLGTIHRWKTAVKPGKPFLFGEIPCPGAPAVPLLGLPGNPGSVLCTMGVFVLPSLRVMGGQKDGVVPPSRRLSSDFSLSPDSRTWYLRVRAVKGKNGEDKLEIMGEQNSGTLSSAAAAHGFALIPQRTAVKPGDPLEFFSFSDLFGLY